MTSETSSLRAAVRAELPWRNEPSLRGILCLEREALVLEPSGAALPRIAIPLGAIVQVRVETTLGMLPALHVRHTVDRAEILSRFEFINEDDVEDETLTLDLANRVGPGLARDAASRLEGGLRALGGGFRGGKRTVRQVVEGVARQDEYRGWPAAITRAQELLARSQPDQGNAPTVVPTAAPPPLIPDNAAVPSGDAATVLRWLKQEMVRWLAICGTRARELGVRDVPVLSPWYPLDSEICRIVVAGEFSRGKSTLINAIFGIHGEIALPTGMTPTTPLACAIRVPSIGEVDGATINYRTKRPLLQLTLDQFRASVRLEDPTVESASDGNPSESSAAVDLHLAEARRVEVRVTGAYLPAGVEIEDTPGLNEQSGRSAAAEMAMGRADLILFVLAADQLLGDLEQDVIDRVLRQGHHRNVLFLVNAWENIDDPQQRQILRERAETLLSEYPSPLLQQQGPDSPPLPILYISALQAARAQRQRKPAPEESGIPQLRAVLRDLLGPQSSALLLRSRSGRAMRYVDLLRAAVSQAAAAATRGNESVDPAEQKAQRYREAVAAASRVVDGLDGAIEGATTPALVALRRGHLVQNGPRDDGVSSEMRRALLLEMRGATAACNEAVRQAEALIVAQIRACFMGRSLVAPALDLPVELSASPPVSAVDELDWRESAAEALHQAIQIAAAGAQAVLLQELQALMAQRETSGTPALQSSGPDAAERYRIAALHSLEEDLVRVQQLLTRCLER